MPNMAEGRVLGQGRVQQHFHVVSLKRRPPEVNPIAVTTHTIAFPNPDPEQLLRVLPLHPDQLPSIMQILCIDAVSSPEELRSRLASAFALTVRPKVIVDYVEMVRALNVEQAIDDDNLHAWAALHGEPSIPKSLLAHTIAPTTDEMAAIFQRTFSFDRTGNAAVRQQQDAAEAAHAPDRGATVPDLGAYADPPDQPAQPSRTTPHHALPLLAGLRTSAGAAGRATLRMAGHLAGDTDSGIMELEVLLAEPTPVRGPAHGETERRVATVHAELEGERRLIHASGGRGVQVRCVMVCDCVRNTMGSYVPGARPCHACCPCLEPLPCCLPGRSLCPTTTRTCWPPASLRHSPASRAACGLWA